MALLSAEIKLADVLQSAGYEMFEIQAILCTIQGVAENQTSETIKQRMGVIAVKTLEKYSK